MQAFIIHFFENSTLSEKTINDLRKELQSFDFDEFHFQSTDCEEIDNWFERSKKEISESDFVIFLYSDSIYGRIKTENVNKELEYAIQNDKIVFLIPLNKIDDNELLNPNEDCETFISVFDTVGKTIVIHYNDFTEYIRTICSTRTEISDRMQNIDRLVSEIEKSYGIESKNDYSKLYNDFREKASKKEMLLNSLRNTSINDLKSLTIQYSSMLASIENLDERRQTSNTVYTTINTALIALMTASLALIAGNMGTVVGFTIILATFFIIPLLGTIICKSWKNTIDGYKNLRSAKFATLDLIESFLPLNTNKAEWQVLKGRDYVTASERNSLPHDMIVLHYGFMVIGSMLILVSLYIWMNG